MTDVPEGTGERVGIAEAASMLELPRALVIRRALDGRLPSTGAGEARTFLRADVDALAARERETNEAMRLLYEEHAAMEGNPSTGP